jgi:UDP-N-acetylglucosamine/UDP-N-acetylgalactosamine diphosphorylase
MKPQMFLFVMLPHTERFAVLEVAHAGEFSLLKNAPSAGTDDSEMSRRDLLAQHCRFFETAVTTLDFEEGIDISSCRHW